MTINPKCRKAKPIFEEERDFIKSHLPEITLPDNCWITGGGTKYVWLDPYCKEYYIKFKCDNYGKFTIIKDNRDKFENYEQIPISQVVVNEEPRITQMYNETVDKTAEFIKTHADVSYSVSVSGGKDSELLMSVWESAIKKSGGTDCLAVCVFQHY